MEWMTEEIQIPIGLPAPGLLVITPIIHIFGRLILYDIFPQVFRCHQRDPDPKLTQNMKEINHLASQNVFACGNIVLNR